MTKIYRILLIITILPIQLLAQSYGNYDKKVVAFGFFPPISSNGTNAGNCINQFSFNLISGYSGALSGIEFAGLTNSERDFVHGAQFAGFGNYVGGEFTGFQFAGFGNFNKSVSTGFQFAGFANWNHDQASGVLAAGFANFTRGKSVAWQFAGFLNYCEDVNGVQVVGFSNVARGNGKVTQIAGFSNTVNGQVRGTQIAGFANISNGNLNGTQIAGFLNKAKNVNGLQLGFINLADSVKRGIPLGFISIVKDGFKEFEVSFSEGLNAQASFKIGIDRFYNIFAIGSQFLGSDFSWAVGYGIGTHIYKTDNFKTQVELISYHINEGESWTNNYNDLQQIKISFTKKINESFSVFAGPTINLLITDNEYKGEQFNSSFAPYTIYSNEGKNTTLKGWFGISAGVKIN